MAQIEFVGVDGCPAGWFSVGFSHSGQYEPEVFASFDQLLTHYKAAKIVLVDIPIGLPECEDPQRREEKTDTVARQVLGQPRSRSVFRAPTRKTIEYVIHARKEDTHLSGLEWRRKHYALANAIESQCTNGIKASWQALDISPKIDEVGKTMLSCQRETIPVVREVHPEILFWALNDQHPTKFPKKNPKSKNDQKGWKERIAVLQKALPRSKAIFDEARSNFSKTRVADDDIVDALAAAVTAWQGWPDSFKTLPETPSKDAKGLTMEMVYWIPD